MGFTLDVSGDLEMSKCNFHLVDFMFLSRGEPVMTHHPELELGITLKDSKGQDQSIKALSPYTAYQSLGCWRCPSGNNSTQKAVLLKKSDEFGAVVARSVLTRQETWTFYTAIYIPNLSYPLPSCTLS